MVFILFAVLVWKFVDFIRLLSNYDDNKSGLITQIIAWISGILLLIVAAHIGKISLPGLDQDLNRISFTSQILLGLFAGSLASGLVDIKQAIDRKDTSSKPRLEIDLTSLKHLFDSTYEDDQYEEELAMMYGAEPTEPADTTIYVGPYKPKEPELE